jgi:hypothetical protein
MNAAYRRLIPSYGWSEYPIIIEKLLDLLRVVLSEVGIDVNLDFPKSLKKFR